MAEAMEQMITDMEALQRRVLEVREHELEEIASYTADQMNEYLEMHCTSTDVVVHGLEMAEGLSEGTAITLHALIQMRSAIEAAMVWVKAHETESALNSEGLPSSESDL